MRGHVRGYVRGCVRGRARHANLASHGLSDLIGSDRSHDKMWETVCERVQIRPPTASHGLSDPVPSNLIGSASM